MYLFQNAALQHGHLKGLRFKKKKKQELLKKITL